jgi:hypothetical protein
MPVIISGLLLALFAPLILGLSNGYEPSTGYSERVYRGNWLIVTGVLGRPHRARSMCSRLSAADVSCGAIPGSYEEDASGDSR